MPKYTLHIPFEADNDEQALEIATQAKKTLVGPFIKNDLSVTDWGDWAESVDEECVDCQSTEGLRSIGAGGRRCKDCADTIEELYNKHFIGD